MIPNVEDISSVYVKKDPFRSDRTFFSNTMCYSVTLQMSPGKLFFSDKCVNVDEPVILCSSPSLPYAWEMNACAEQCASSYQICFGKEILAGLYGADGVSYNLENCRNPAFALQYEDVRNFNAMFRLLYKRFDNHSLNRKLLSSYLNVILSELENIPVDNGGDFSYSAAQRITELFLNLIDSQFPPRCIVDNVSLLKPSQYADRLCIQVNHLNRVVREITGKTTTEIIADRLVAEARIMLVKTNLSIAEIALRLGFEEPSSFSRFIRKHTGTTPQSLRKR